MNLKIHLAFSLFLFAIVGGAWSQIQQPYRFEQEVKSTDEPFNVISLKKEGLAFIRDLDKHEGSKKKWQLEIVDTTLVKSWSTELLLDNRMTLVGYEYTPQHLFLLFREGEFEHYNFQLHTLRFNEKSIETHNIKFEVNFKMTHFTVSGTSAIFGGYINYEPAVLLYDQTSDHPKVLPGLFITDGLLLDIRANQNLSFNVLLSEKTGKDVKRLVHRTYDHEGNLLIDDIIEVDPKFKILTGVTSTLEREELIIVGTYSEGNNQSAASGFFSVVVDPFNEQSINYIDFPSLEHFLDYLPKKRIDKIKLKAREQKVTGRTPDFKAYVAPFRIDERANGFYVYSEVYIASSQATSFPNQRTFDNPVNYGYGYYGSSLGGRPFSSTYNSPVRNSDVTMIESVVLVLDENGHPKRDLSLKLEEAKQAALEQLGDFVILRDSVFLVSRKMEDILYHTEVTDTLETMTKLSVKIKMPSKNDVLKGDDEQGNVRFWYDHHFYIWGYQNIKNPTLTGDQTRHVFYVNRISVE